MWRRADSGASFSHAIRSLDRWSGFRAAGVAVAAMAVVAACATTRPRAYEEAKAAAQRAYSAGRYDDAAQLFDHAARLSADRRDAEEMLYRKGAAYHRGGRDRAARRAYEDLIDRYPQGARTARAAFEIADLELGAGRRDAAYDMLRDFVWRYPSSGLARRALLRYVQYLDNTQGPAGTLRFLQSHRRWLSDHDLGEVASYEMAKRLEALGDMARARDAYVQTAERYPYPYGGLFDDALYRASVLDERLGDPSLAIEHLRQMLRVRESARLHGSYERPRFAEAQMRIAELVRDALHDLSSARREFRKLFDEFQTSTLRDDALWQEALIALRQSDRDGACGALQLLTRHFPSSRYVGCASLVCATSTPRSDDRDCRPYLRRQLYEDRSLDESE